MSGPNYSQILDDIRKQSNVLKSPCVITGISYHDSLVPLGKNNQPLYNSRQSASSLTGDVPGHWTSEMKLSYRCIHEGSSSSSSTNNNSTNNSNTKSFTGTGNMKKSSRFETCRRVVEWWVKSHPRADQITNREVEALIAKRKLELGNPIGSSLNGSVSKKQRKSKRRGEGSSPKNPSSNPTQGLTLEMANHLITHAKDFILLCLSYGIQLNQDAVETSSNPSIFTASITLPDANGQIDTLGTGVGATREIALSVAHKSINKNRLAEHMTRLLPPPLTSVETLVETVQRTVTSDPDEFAKWLLHFSQDQAHYCSSSSTEPSEHAHGTWVVGIEIEGSRPHKTIGTIQVGVDGAVIIYSLHGSQWPTVPEGTAINYVERLPAIFMNILQCPKFYKLVGGGFVQPMLSELVTNNLQGIVHVGDAAAKLGYERKAPQSKLSVGLTGLQSKKRNSLRVNWHSFPLTDEMITYATADVLLTFQIGASLSRRLRAIESLSSEEETKETTWIDCPSITAVLPLELPTTLPPPTIANITLPSPPPPPSLSKSVGPSGPSGRAYEGRRRRGSEPDPYRRPRLSRAEEEEYKRRGRLPPPGVRRRGLGPVDFDEFGRPLPPPGPPGRYPPPPRDRDPRDPRDRDYRPRSPPNPWRSIDISRDHLPPEPEVIRLPRLTPGQPLPSLHSYRSEPKTSYLPPPPPSSSSTYTPYPSRPASPPPPPSSSSSNRSAASYYQTISTYTNSTSFRSVSPPPRSQLPPTTTSSPSRAPPKSPPRYSHQASEPTFYPPLPPKTTSAPPPPPPKSAPLYLPPSSDYRGGPPPRSGPPVPEYRGGYSPSSGDYGGSVSGNYGRGPPPVVGRGPPPVGSYQPERRGYPPHPSPRY